MEFHFENFAHGFSEDLDKLEHSGETAVSMNTFIKSKQS